MALKAIYVATSTAEAIEQLAKQSIGDNVQVALKVKDLQANSETTLQVQFFRPKKGDLLHGRTEDGHIFIKLGEVDQRQLKHPSVVHYVKSAVKNSTKPKGPLQSRSKRW